LKTVLFNAAIVGTGGFIGAICRYGMSAFVQRNQTLSAFPYGTLLVNLAGCLLIGIAVGMIDQRHLLGPEVRLFVLVGLLGGFTTYSTFAWETLTVAKGSGFVPALTYVSLHIIAGLALAAAGYALVAR
jgi:CrcB protein